MEKFKLMKVTSLQEESKANVVAVHMARPLCLESSSVMGKFTQKMFLMFVGKHSKISFRIL